VHRAARHRLVQAACVACVVACGAFTAAQPADPAAALDTAAAAVHRAMAAARAALAAIPDGADLADAFLLADAEQSLRGAAPDVGLLHRVLARTSRTLPPPVQQPVDGLRRELRRFVDLLELAVLPDATEAIGAARDTVQRRLAAPDGGVSADEADRLRDAFRLLARADDALVAVAADRLSFPNQVFRIDKRYIDLLVRDAIRKPVTFAKPFGAARVSGSGSATARIEPVLVPHPSRGDLILGVRGAGTVALHATRSPLTVRGQARMRFDGEQRLLITPQGIDFTPPATRVRNTTTIASASLAGAGPCVRRLAEPLILAIARRAIAARDPQVANLAEERVESMIEDQVVTAVDQINALVRRLVWDVVEARDVMPGAHVETHADCIRASAEYRTAWQLAAIGPPPALSEPPPHLSLQFHHTAFTNAAGVMAGRRIDEFSFRELFFGTLGLQLPPDAASPVVAIPAAFRFADAATPLEVTFADGRLSFRLTLQSVDLDNATTAMPDVTAGAHYAVTVTDEEIALDREGDVFVEADEDTLAAAVRGAIGRFLVPRATISRTLGARVPATSRRGDTTRIADFDVADGWLTLGIVRTPAGGDQAP
jgi:hypothetical protein